MVCFYKSELKRAHRKLYPNLYLNKRILIGDSGKSIKSLKSIKNLNFFQKLNLEVKPVEFKNISLMKLLKIPNDGEDKDPNPIIFNQIQKIKEISNVPTKNYFREVEKVVMNTSKEKNYKDINNVKFKHIKPKIFENLKNLNFNLNNLNTPNTYNKVLKIKNRLIKNSPAHNKNIIQHNSVNHDRNLMKINLSYESNSNSNSNSNFNPSKNNTASKATNSSLTLINLKNSSNIFRRNNSKAITSIEFHSNGVLNTNTNTNTNNFNTFTNINFYSSVDNTTHSQMNIVDQSETFQAITEANENGNNFLHLSVGKHLEHIENLELESLKGKYGLPVIKKYNHKGCNSVALGNPSILKINLKNVKNFMNNRDFYYK
jgi:hypothetical protein